MDIEIFRLVLAVAPLDPLEFATLFKGENVNVATLADTLTKVELQETVLEDREDLAENFKPVEPAFMEILASSATRLIHL